MSYQLTTRSMPGYLHITITGENSVENVTDYITKVGALCDEQKMSVVLIEENLRGPGLTMFDIFKVIRGLQLMPKILKWIAYVDTNPEHDSTMMDFARELAVRRGLRVHICKTVGEAEEWAKIWSK